MSLNDLLLRYNADGSGVTSELAKIGAAHEAVGGQARTLGQSISGVGLAFTKTVTPAALAVGALFAKSFKEWDGGMDAIRVRTGATGQALEGLGGSMKKVGGQVTQPLSEVGKVIGEIGQRTGLTGPPLEKLSTQVLHLAQITGTDAVQAVGSLTRVFGDWGIEASKQSGALDQLFRASQQTGIGVSDLSEKIVFFGAPMRQLGFSFSESAALLGKWEKEGVNVDTVLGGMRQSLGRLISPTTQFEGVMAKISPTFHNAFMAATTTQERFKLVKDEILRLYATGSQTDKLKAGELSLEAFGRRAGADVVAAFGEGRFAIGDLLTTVANGRDTINKATKDTEDWTEKFGHLKNAVMGALGPFGQIGAAVSGGLAAIGPALFGIGQVIPLLGKLGPAVSTLGTVFATVGSSVLPLLANPIVLAVAGIAIAVFLLIKHWDTVKTALATTWHWIATTASTIWNGITGFFKQWGTTILAVITGPIGLLVLFLVRNWNRIKADVASIWNGILGFLRTIWNTITSTISRAVTGAVNTVRTVFSRVRGIVATAWNDAISWLRGVPGRIVSAVGSLGGILVEAGRNVIRGLISGIKSMFGALADAAGAVGSWIASHKGPIAYDRQMLVPHGIAMMQGLAAGIARGVDTHIARAVAGVNGSFPSLAMPISLAAAGGGGVSARTSFRDDRIVNALGRLEVRLVELERAFDVRLELDGEQVARRMHPRHARLAEFEARARG